MTGPEDILPTYDRVAAEFEAERSKDLYERAWLDWFMARLVAPTVLDLGCGPGVPIATYLASRGARIVGVDGAPAMVAAFRRNLPTAEAIVADMRGLDLGRVFDGIVAWDSFFHLSPDDQRDMFPVFARHTEAGSQLLVTTGSCAGKVQGHAGGAEVYHASLDPDEYHAVFRAHDFDVVRVRLEDPHCHGHSVWHAEKRASASHDALPRSIPRATRSQG